MMRHRPDRRAYSVLLFTLMLLLSSCGPLQKVGTIPRGTPDTGNGTPAVLPTPDVTAPPAQKAPANATGSTYAFVRNRQLMVALHGQSARQVTSFNYTDLPNVFWQTPSWSQDDHFLAFIVNARKSGLGGGGCPGPDDQVGSLYVLDMQTNQIAQITLPRIQPQIQANTPPNADNWKYASWEDATHLLAWYNGGGGNGSNVAGLYRYDMNSKAIALVIPLQAMGAQSDADLKNGMPFVLSVRVRNGKLFYETVAHPYEQQSQLSIYVRSITKPGQQSNKLLDLGSEAWCSMQASAPYVIPGWDVSPDGEQLAAQLVLGSIQVLHLTDRSTTNLFTDIPARVLSRDVLLTWAPDNQTVVLSQNDTVQSQDGLYTASLANPVLTEHYAPTLSGQVIWRADSAAFALQSAPATQPDSGSRTSRTSRTSPQNVYVFVKGDAHGQILVPDARNFCWG